MSRLQTYYKETVVPHMLEKFSYANVMEVPKVTKITLNMGVGEAVGDKKVMARAVGDMEAIAGQKVIVNNAGDPSRALRSVTAGRLVARSLCAGKRCMNFSTAW